MDFDMTSDTERIIDLGVGNGDGDNGTFSSAAVRCKMQTLPPHRLRLRWYTVAISVVIKFNSRQIQMCYPYPSFWARVLEPCKHVPRVNTSEPQM